nr:NADH dehydrogenase subunit 6 [Amblyseius tsugawai]
MLTMFKLINLILMLMFMFQTNPMTKIIIMGINIMFMMLIINYLNKTSWFNMMFIILMIGGLMVLFIYFTSLYTEKKTKNSKVANFIILLILSSIFNEKISLKFNMNLENTFLNYFINLNYSAVMLLLIIYMLLLLLINLEMISSMKTSFRSMHFFSNKNNFLM